MTTDKEPGLQGTRKWLDWLSVHTWWAALLVGGVLCILALILG